MKNIQLWVHLKGANSMAVSGLSFKNTLIGTRLAASLLLCTNRLRKQSSQGPQFLEAFSEEQLLAKSFDYCKRVNR